MSEALTLLGTTALIFGLRICDVSLGTLRIGFLVRGKRRLAGIFGFFESLVWLVAAAQVLNNLDSPFKFLAYAGGYAAGTMLGVSIERWLAMGDTLMRIVSPVGSPSVDEALRLAGFYVTVVNAKGRDGDVSIGFTVLPRRRMAEALKVVEATAPRAFVTFEATTPVRAGLKSPLSVRK